MFPDQKNKDSSVVYVPKFPIQRGCWRVSGSDIELSMANFPVYSPRSRLFHAFMIPVQRDPSLVAKRKAWVNRPFLLVLHYRENINFKASLSSETDCEVSVFERPRTKAC